MPEQMIRVYKVDERGHLYDARETIDIEDFCGTVPRVGDMIVSPAMTNVNESDEPHKRDLHWENRIVQVVKAVYFRPDKRGGSESDAWAVLVVKDRQMTEAEWALL